MNWNTCNAVFEVFPIDGEVLHSLRYRNRDEVIWVGVKNADISITPSPLPSSKSPD